MYVHTWKYSFCKTINKYVYCCKYCLYTTLTVDSLSTPDTCKGPRSKFCVCGNTLELSLTDTLIDKTVFSFITGFYCAKCDLQ